MTNTRTKRVELGPRSYDVTVGVGLLDRAGELLGPFARPRGAATGGGGRVVIITDSNHVILSAIQADTIAQRFSPDIKIPKEEMEE